MRDESPTPNGFPPFIGLSAESSSEVSEGEGRSPFHPGMRQQRRCTPRKSSKCVDSEEYRNWKYPRPEEVTNGIIQRRSSCDDRNAFKSRIPCLDPPTKKLSCQQKAQSTEDLYSINFKCYKSDHPGNYNSYSRGSSPSHTPVKGRRASTGTGTMPRSQSQTYGEMDDRQLTLSRQGPGRYSCRNLRTADIRPKIDTGNKTWTFRQKSPRSSVARETYRPRKSPCATPKIRSPTKSLDNNTIHNTGSPVRNKQISPLLEEMLHDDSLDSDEKILEKMEMLINQYKKKIVDRKQEDDLLFSADDENQQPDEQNSNGKDSIGVSPSKIPLRVWRN